MRGKLWLIVFTVALLGLTAGGLSLASADSSEISSLGPWGRNALGANLGPAAPAGHHGGQTIVVVPRETDFKFIDADHSGRDSSGDYFLFREEMVTIEGDHVGFTNATCTVHFPFTRNVNTFLCEASATFFDKGQVTVFGRLTFARDSFEPPVLAVTGGTMHFQNVRGEVHLSERGGEEVLIFHLLP